MAEEVFRETCAMQSHLDQRISEPPEQEGIPQRTSQTVLGRAQCRSDSLHRPIRGTNERHPRSHRGEPRCSSDSKTVAGRGSI
jgi:hypothetical protein